jgi:hypothetical protein
VTRSTERFSVTAATLCVVLAVSLAAKAPTVRLTIAGPDLPSPVEITNPKALASIWAGSFIGASSEELDKSLPRYLITFYVRWANASKETIKPKYVVTYVRDPRTGRGFVYLPGRGEAGYAMNVGAMERNGQDGRWHIAEAEWSDAITRALGPLATAPSARNSAPHR